MGRRTVLLVVSVLVAAVGVGLVAVYVLSADQRAERAVKVREILVVQDDEEPNTPIGDVDFQPTRFTEESIPAGAITAADVAGLVASGQQLNQRVEEGIPLVKGMFGPASDLKGAEAVVDGAKADMSIVPVRLSAQGVAQLAGQVVPGAMVTLINATGGRSVVIVPKVEVVALGPELAGGQETVLHVQAKQEEMMTIVAAVESGVPVTVTLPGKDADINPAVKGQAPSLN